MGTHPIFESDFDCLTETKLLKMNVFRRLPVFFQTMAGMAPFVGATWAYSKYLSKNAEDGLETTRLSKFERDRDMIGLDKIIRAREDSTVKCYMDIEISGEPVGRLEYVLYDSIVPQTVRNFEILCRNKCKSGMANPDKSTLRALHHGYERDKARFFRVVPGFVAQCGMMPITGNVGQKKFNIYGTMWPDENFAISHDKRGILSMANKGPDTNGSQFFITFDKSEKLNGVHVAFGEVVSGFDVLDKIEEMGVA